QDAIRWDTWLASMAPIDHEPQQSPSAMIYTSGTTGYPKGVRRQPLSPENARIASAFRGRMYGCREGKRCIVPGPMYHSAPNRYSLQASMVSDLLVIMPRFEALEFLRLVEKHAVTVSMMAPIMFILLLKLTEARRNQYDVSSMEFIVHVAAPCPVDVKQGMIDWFGPIINEFYGSTESGAV